MTGFSLSEPSKCISTRLSFSSALSELSSRACTPMGLGEELEHSEELPSRAAWWGGCSTSTRSAAEKGQVI